MTSPGTISDPRVEDSVAHDRSWTVVVWDDPVNLMDYVVFVFRRVLSIDSSTATKLMLEVHNDGKARVFSGVRERAESVAAQMHSNGLWATMSR